MKKTPAGARHPARRVRTGAGPLAHPERAELQRQGAKAAARGDEASTNPMHAAPNKPSETGESAQTWGQRRDAWQQGFDAQSGEPGEGGDAEPPPPGGAADPH